LTELPGEQRRVFLWRYWRGLSIQEIADEVGKTRPAVAGILRRAMIAVRAALPEEEG
jgi:DNA-directed RNA polymerase specialized sigma24 family protein